MRREPGRGKLMPMRGLSSGRSSPPSIADMGQLKPAALKACLIRAHSSSWRSNLAEGADVGLANILLLLSSTLGCSCDDGALRPRTAGLGGDSGLDACAGSKCANG